MLRSNRARLLALFLSCSLLSSSLSVMAQGVKPATKAPAKKKSLKESLKGEALEAFNRGVELYKNQNFEGAKAEFEQAYNLSKDVRLLFNVAIAERDAKRYSRAVARLEQLLQEGDELSDKDKQDARDLLEGLKQYTAPITVSVNEPDATVFVDDIEVGKSPLNKPLTVDVGERNIVARKVGFLDASKRITVSGGKADKVELNLEAAQKKGMLSVRATGAPSAVVFVDGVEQGLAPWQGEVSADKHTVEIRAKGYVTESRTEIVPHKGTIVIEVALRPDQGKVRVKTDKPENVIFLDEQEVGKGIWEGVLPSGPHMLKVTRSGAEPYNSQIFVQTDQVGEVQVTLRSKGGVPWYAWVIGGGVLLGGGIATYFLVKPGTKDPQAGTIQPGIIAVNHGFRF
ncbi:MAG: PEGA domain-containing protein [Myxococcales bacterium]|nr:PEGA domain-containing protein [Myxococcales bacterium]